MYIAGGFRNSRGGGSQIDREERILICMFKALVGLQYSGTT